MNKSNQKIESSLVISEDSEDNGNLEMTAYQLEIEGLLGGVDNTGSEKFRHRSVKITDSQKQAMQDFLGTPAVGSGPVKNANNPNPPGKK